MVGLTQLGVTWGCDKDANKVPPDRASDAKRLSVTQISKSEQLLTQLARTIEGEIIPRLMLTHRVSVETFFDPVQEGETFLLSENVADFVDLSLKYDVDAAASYIAALRAQGTPLEAVYLDLLTPTARRLGDMWVEDLCDFTQVTVGLCCLQQLLHELSADFHSESAKEYQAQGRRALLLPVPGEQHTFGLYMLMEFFRRAGWDVWDNPATSNDEVTDMVRREWFEIVGFSVSCESRIDQLTAGIRAIRRASCNPRVGVLVGGQVFNEHPEFVAMVGADATASDGKQSVLRAEQLITLLAENQSKPAD